jgi:hypothetical protein
VKTCEDVAQKFSEIRPDCFNITTPRLYPAVSGETQNGCHPPPTDFPELAPCDFFLFPKMKLNLKGRRFDTIEDIQAESPRVLDTLTERLPGSVPKMEKTVGSVSTHGRELLRG